MAMGWLDVAMLLAALATAGAVAGIIGGAMRIGGGIVLAPALLGVLPLTPQEAAGPAITVAVAANLLLSAWAAWRNWRDGRVDMHLLRRWVPGLAVGGAIGGAGLAFMTPMIATILVAGALILGAMAMVAPLPALGGLSGWSRTVLAVAAGAVSVLGGMGGGTLGRPLLAGHPAPMAQAAGLGVALGLPAVLVMMAGAVIGQGVGPAWFAAALLVALAAHLTAPMGTRLASAIPAPILRWSIGLGVVLAGFSLLRATLAA